MNLPRLLLRLVLGRRFPLTHGSLVVDGVREPVRIGRDAWGVPYVDARSEPDAWYGLGFCHGQDRTFQLELLLRVVRGTLAELIGPEGLPVDRLSRRIGFRVSAERQLAALAPDVREMLVGYARGVTAGATRGLPRPPHELAILRARPTAWTEADPLGVMKLMSFLLAANWDSELARLTVLRESGPEALAALDPAYPEWHPVTAPPGALAGQAADRLSADLVAFTAVTGAGGGSNNWALAAARTATHRPLLANDPHLAPTLPPHWYLARLRTPEWSAAGASFVGAPGFPAGHNGFAAWGVTAGFVDGADLFIEEVGPDGRSVRQGSGFVPCEVREERIAVKGGPDVVEQVLVTPRGPIIGPALLGEPGAVSLRAIWLDPLPARGLLRMHRARGFEDFRSAFAEWPGPSLNMAYADASGAIGWQLTGQAPRRRKGYGTIPLAGWDPDAGWEEHGVPFEEMPHLADPPQGYVATANNRPVAEGAGPFLGVDWIEGYRLARIGEALAARSDWDVAGTRELQLDQESVPWRELREHVLRASASEPETAAALELLRAWDGRVSADSAAAAVFELFVAEMVRRVAAARAPRGERWAAGAGFTPLVARTTFAVRRVGHLVRLLRERPAGWLARSWDDEVAAALGAAVRRLRAGHGPDPAGWAWGRVRPLTLLHPFGAKKPFDRVFNLGPVPCGGDANTPAQATVDPLEPTANPMFIASLRMVIDVGAWDASSFALPGGQSGNPLSPNYADQFPLWQRGEGIAIAWSEAAVAQVTRQTLALLPAGATTA